MDQEDALQIYQDWLDATSQAVLDNDVEHLLKFISLPYTHKSAGGRMIIETREDLAYGQTVFAESLRVNAVNHFIRLATKAEFLSRDYIEGQHVTHMLSNARPVVPSFTDRVVLRRTGEHWKLTELAVSARAGDWPVRIIRAGQYPEAVAGAQEDDARREATEPLALYQTFLNRLTQANVEDDFEAYCNLLHYPHTVHTETEDQIRQTAQESRGFFEYLSNTLHDNQIEGFMRIADHAEFISGREICGYHTTRFLSGGTDALEAVKSRMILRRDGARWRLISVTNSLKDEQYPHSGSRIPGDLVTQKEIQERTKEWPKNLH